jgi:hypothetical protein
MRCELINRLKLERYSWHSVDLRDVVETLWHQMAAEKKLHLFFPSCGANWTPDAWWRQLIRDRVLLVVGRDAAKDTFLGFILLAGLRPRRAFLHYCWFNDVGMAIIEASRWVCDTVISDHDLDVLIALTPENNVKASRLAKMTGFVLCGHIPRGSYVFSLNRSVDSQIWCYTKGTAPAQTMVKGVVR